MECLDITGGYVASFGQHNVSRNGLPLFSWTLPSVWGLFVPDGSATGMRSLCQPKFLNGCIEGQLHWKDG